MIIISSSSSTKLNCREYDIKLVVLGLTAVFELPLASLPPVVQQGAKFILEALVTLLKLSAKLKKGTLNYFGDRVVVLTQI